MAITAPPPRIGKTTGTRPRPADSEKLPRGARFHVASEIAAGDVTAKKVVPKRKGRTKRSAGLINRTAP